MNFSFSNGNFPGLHLSTNKFSNQEFSSSNNFTENSHHQIRYQNQNLINPQTTSTAPTQSGKQNLTPAMKLSAIFEFGKSP